MGSPDPRAERGSDRRAWGLAAPWLATALALLAAAYLPFRSLRDLPHVPLTEDGYYLLSVSRNVALGNGVTIDGTALTNGFQPLFAFLLAPVYLLTGGERYETLRYVLGLGWPLLLGTALLLGLIARDLLPREQRRERAWLLALTVLLYVSSAAFRLHFNGMETGLLLFVLALTWRFHQQSPLIGTRSHVALGALLGLCVLARNDCVFLTILVALSRMRAAPTRAIGWRNFLQVSVVAFLVSSPWWIYNVTVFGDLMPTSGRAQQYRLLSPARLEFALEQWSRQAVPWLYPHGLPRRAILLLQVAALGAMGYLLRREPRGAERDASPGRSEAVGRTFEFGLALTASTLVLVAWYGLTSGARWHYFRYFAPVLLVGVPAAAFAVARPCARRPLAGILIALILLPQVPSFVTTVCSSAFSWSELGTNGYYKNQLSLVRDHVPPGDPVAASQSGTLGYFRDRVVNLDGKVNNEVLAAPSAPRKLLERSGIRWYCDAPRLVPRVLGVATEREAWELVDRRFGFVLYRRGPAADG